MELGTGTKDRYKKITFWKDALDELLVKLFIESHESAPAEIVLDVDTTDLPLHGKQEGRFFHGYYDHYCYLPLYIFCGEQVLCARLREANHDAAFGSLREIQGIVAQIRTAWPAVKIILRGDSGFCRNQLMSWCEDHGVDFVLGLARNQRLRKIIVCARRFHSIQPSGRNAAALLGRSAEFETCPRRAHRAPKVGRSICVQRLR
jgi:Transposase DDE domain group 1